MRGIGTDRFGVRLVWDGSSQAAADPADLQACRKALKIALLLVGEVNWDGFDFHGAQRSSSSHVGGIGKTESDRRELDSAAGAGSISQGSDQPRCCGNPSRTYASAPSAVADCTAPYKLHAIPIGTESQLRSCRYTNVLGGVRARRGLFSSSRPKCGRTPQVTTSVSAGPEVRAPPQRPLPRTDRLR